MEVNPEWQRGGAFFVRPGDTVLIRDGYFHKVWNESETEDLIFICVFEKYDRDSNVANYDEQ
jgi:oxalate decarboxylase/phosphoglucose isomerase-like protein (cupin superfamily)